MMVSLQSSKMSSFNLLSISNILNCSFARKSIVFLLIISSESGYSKDFSISQSKDYIGLIKNTQILCKSVKHNGGTFFSAQEDDEPKNVVVEVILNNFNVGSEVLIKCPHVIHASQSTLNKWNIPTENYQPAFKYYAENWYSLNEISQAALNIDIAAMALNLTIPIEKFKPSVIGLGVSKNNKFSLPQWATYLNYDLNMFNSKAINAGESKELNGIFELALTTPYGFLSSGYAANLQNDRNQPSHWSRLETSFSNYGPDSQIAWSIGDAATSRSNLTRAVNFGGLQIKKNLNSISKISTFDASILSGIASVPSTVEVYVNGMLRKKTMVPAGVFSLADSAAIPESGEIKIVTKDALGKEFIQNFPIYTDASLLQPSIVDWSLDVGFMRNRLGSQESGYGDGLFTGMLRKGIERDLTLEGKVELSKSLRTFELGAAVALATESIGQIGISLSSSNDQVFTSQWMLGFRWNDKKQSGYLRFQGADSNYRSLGLNQANSPIQLATSYNFSLNNFGAISLSFNASRSAINNDLLKIFSASHSTRVGGRASLNLTISQFSSNIVTNEFLGISLVMPLGGGTNYMTGVNQQNNQIGTYIGAHKGSSQGSNIGWQTALGTRSGETYSDGGLLYQNEVGIFSGSIFESNSLRTTRVGIQGGLIFIEENLFVSAPVQDSFALVDVSGFRDIPINLNGTTVAKSNSKGLAFIPRLNSFNENRISINPNDFPIGADIKLIQQEFYPSQRNALKALFPIKFGRSAIFQIVFDDGELAPFESELTNSSDGQTFYVDRKGKVFATGLSDQNFMRLSWGNYSCSLSVDLPAVDNNEVIQLSPQICIRE